MIRNVHERRVTQRKLTELTEAAEAKGREPMPDGRDPEMHQLVIDGFHTQIAQLQAELDAYAELAAGHVNIQLPDLDTLGDELVRARIAAGLSQRELDEAAGLAEGVIRRYERENYNGASLHRLQLIQHTLQSALMDPTNTTDDETDPVALVFARADALANASRRDLATQESLGKSAVRALNVVALLGDNQTTTDDDDRALGEWFKDAALDEVERRRLVMAALGMSLADIATIEGVSETDLRTSLKKARKQLRHLAN